MDKELPRPNESPSLSTDKGFWDIELDAEEEQEALRMAREAKHYRIIREEYARRITEAITPPVFTAEEVFKSFQEQFQVEAGSKYEVIVKHLCAYFTNDPRCSRDPKKGLFLCGGVGVGKTTLMEFFQRNQKASYRIVSCRDVESAYGSTDKESGGENAIGQYSYNFKVPINSNPFGHQWIGYCFDDLGTEVTGKHYGKDKEVMIDVLLNRYDNRLDMCMTHLTTNLSSEQVKDRYGIRVFDRMREMFNIIDFPITEKSRRK